MYSKEDKRLQTKDLKLARVTQNRKRLELEVKDDNNTNTKYIVTVHTWNELGDVVKVAFCFTYKSISYALEAEGGKVKLDKIEEAGIGHSSPADKYLFQWVDSGRGQWRGLRSVADPKKHLCINGQNKFILSSNSDEFRLT
ncbi:uncharacterized protein ACJ7VT_009476 [Polymixia lowei]